jgi:hypothetical protein
MAFSQKVLVEALVTCYCAVSVRYGVKFSTLGWKGGKMLCQVVLSFRKKILLPKECRIIPEK